MNNVRSHIYNIKYVTLVLGLDVISIYFLTDKEKECWVWTEQK